MNNIDYEISVNAYMYYIYVERFIHLFMIISNIIFTLIYSNETRQIMEAERLKKYRKFYIWMTASRLSCC